MVELEPHGRRGETIATHSSLNTPSVYISIIYDAFFQYMKII